MTAIATAKPSVSAYSAGTPAAARRSPIGAPSVAPEIAPLTMPTRVMPICTVERNLPGSAASCSAVFAPPLPRSASIRSRAVRAETIASSDIENTPLSTINASRRASCDHGKGDMRADRLAD